MSKPVRVVFDDGREVSFPQDLDAPFTGDLHFVLISFSDGEVNCHVDGDSNVVLKMLETAHTRVLARIEATPPAGRQ